MATSKAAKRYARAIFDLARDSTRLEAVRSDMDSISTLLAGSPELRRFVENPLIPSKLRTETLREVFEGKSDTITLHTLLLLERKNRLPLLDEICNEVERLYCESKGILKVHVTAASPLTDGQVTEMTRRLAARFSRKIELDVAIDPSLLGGFRVRAGDQVYDVSVSAQLDRFKNSLIHA